jgi:predicted esterase
MQLRLTLLALSACALVTSHAAAEKKAKADTAPKPWCAPEVNELSDHVCWFDGGTPDDGRRTLVIYLHGALAMTPGFQYLQQRSLAFFAKRHGFTVLIPTGPSDGVGYVWPTSQKDQKEKEPEILANITKARADLEKKVGHSFDETFVIGFSSGAYWGSSIAVRGGLDADGFLFFAGGSSWVQATESSKKQPIFVGVSAKDPQTANHSRAFAGTLATLGWPYKVEEQPAGHTIDWTLLAHGLKWVREKKSASSAKTASR